MVPADSQSFASGSSQDVVMIDDDVQIPEAAIETATDMVSVGNNVPLPKPLSMPILENNIVERHSQPSTSTVKNNTPRMLRFNIQYCDRTIPIDIPDTGTIGKYLFVYNLEFNRFEAFEMYFYDFYAFNIYRSFM